MAISDVFIPDGKVELKIADLKELYRLEATSYAENKFIINALKGGVPREHILTMIGNKEDVN